MRILLTPVAVAAVLALSACGGDGGSNDEDDVKSTVNGVYDALADKDEGKVCDSLSKQGRDQIAKGAGKGQSCEEVFKLGFAFAGDALKKAGDAEVTEVSIDGDKATATVKLDKETGKVPLVKEDGEWKLNDLQNAGAN